MNIVQDLKRGRRVRRRRKRLPTLLLPITRGPLENFYHFFMGYFVPVYWNRLQHPHRDLAVMSIPPFNDWFDLLPGDSLKQVDQAKAMKHAFLADSRGFAQHYRVDGLMYWDKWENFGGKPLRNIATEMQVNLQELAGGIQTTTPEVVVLGRGYTPEFYAKRAKKPYGASKRDIPNLAEITDTLGKYYDVELVDGAAISPLEMFLKCNKAQIVVGQHGAGLTNIFFSQPASAMLEIVWPALLPDAHVNIYGPLCDELGVRWSRPTLQADSFTCVDPGEVLKEVSRLIG